MESLEKLQSRFPFVESWEETGKLTRKGHRVIVGRFETFQEYWVPDAFGDDGNWDTAYGLVVITAIVDVKNQQGLHPPRGDGLSFKNHRSTSQE